MGFNLGSFGAGLLTGVADTAVKQRKDIDSRIDKYLDFGVQRGTAIMDERKAERKKLTQLGNQLKQRSLSNDQISSLLEGGVESATQFLTAIHTVERGLPAGESYDAGALVTMEGKESGQTWQDYVDKRIMGTVDTSDAFAGSGIKSSGRSILGNMFGIKDTGAVSQDDVRNRASMVGGTMGYSLQESLAASQGSFIRQADDEVRVGLVRLAGDPAAQQQLLNFKQDYQRGNLQITQLSNLIKTGVLNEEAAVGKRAFEKHKRIYDTKLLDYEITNNMGIQALQIQHDTMVAEAIGAGVPKTFEGAQIYFTLALREELAKRPEEQEPWKIKNLQKDKLEVDIAFAMFQSQKSAGSGSNPYTHSMLTSVYKAAESTAMYATFGSDKIGRYIYDTANQRWDVINPNNLTHAAALQVVKEQVAENWIDIMEGQKAYGPAYQLLRAVHMQNVPGGETQLQRIAREAAESTDGVEPEVIIEKNIVPNIVENTELGSRLNPIHQSTLGDDDRPNDDLWYVVKENIKGEIVESSITGLEFNIQRDAQIEADETSLLDTITPRPLDRRTGEATPLSELGYSVANSYAYGIVEDAKGFIREGDKVKIAALLDLIKDMPDKLNSRASVAKNKLNRAIALLTAASK